MDTVLSWDAGTFAASHDVYFGTSLNDVNNASRAKPAGLLASQGQTGTTFDPPGLMAYGQTYYWRVDEVNKAPDGTIYKGAVWSFTTEPYGYPITKLTATASSAQNSMGPEKTIDGSGPDGRPARHRREHDVDEHGRPAELDSVPVRQSLQAVGPEGLEFQPAGRELRRLRRQGRQGRVFDRRHHMDSVGQRAPVRPGPGLPDYAANTTVSFGGVTGQVRQADHQQPLGAA